MSLKSYCKILLCGMINVIMAAPIKAQSELSRQKQVNDTTQAFEQNRAKNLENRQRQLTQSTLPIGFTFQARGLTFETFDQVMLSPKGETNLGKSLKKLPSGFALYTNSGLDLPGDKLRVVKKQGTTYYPAVREKNSGEVFYITGKLRIRTTDESALKAFAAQQDLTILLFQTELQLGIVAAKEGTDLQMLLQKAQQSFAKVELDLNGSPRSFH